MTVIINQHDSCTCVTGRVCVIIHNFTRAVAVTSVAAANDDIDVCGRGKVTAMANMHGELAATRD